MEVILVYGHIELSFERVQAATEGSTVGWLERGPTHWIVTTGGRSEYERVHSVSSQTVFIDDRQLGRFFGNEPRRSLPCECSNG